MTDRVHPAAGSPQATASPTPPENPPTRGPQPGTYVIQVPKDQVYRMPLPENAAKYQRHHRPGRRGCCCRCLCWTVLLLLSLLLAAAAAAGVLYLVFRPKAPTYSVERLSFKGFNLTSPPAALPLSPEVDVTVRAQNSNRKIGVYYKSGSSVKLFYSDIELCSGALPVFFQGARNVTVFSTALRSSGIRLPDAVRTALGAGQRDGNISLVLDVRVPVRIKVGAVRTWTITIKVRCDLTVDKLTKDAKLLSKSCKGMVDPLL